MFREILVLSCAFLMGCSGAFQPVPPAYKLWSKDEATELEIQKALLECGFTHPNGGNLSSGVTFNEVNLSRKCMLNAGYIYFNPFKGKPELNSEIWCGKNSETPAFQPDAIIPTPSVERRLNSPYCQRRTSYQACYDDFLKRRENYCQTLEYPYWNAPLDWLDEQDCEAAQIRRAADYCGRGDYSKLPAECLP